jgi:hypothetical protein
MARFPNGTCSGTVTWKLVGGDWFPVNPPPSDAACTAASVFEFQGQTIQVDTQHGLPKHAFDALRAAFADDIKEDPPGSGMFTLPMVPNGKIVKIP